MDSVDIAFLVIELVTMVLCVVSNTVILMAILSRRKLRNKISYQVILILSLANIAYGMITVPIDIIISLLNTHLSFESCIIMQSLTVVTHDITYMVVLCGQIEVFIAIRRPSFYKAHCNVKNIRRSGCLPFLISFLFGMAPTTGWNKGRHNYEVTLNYTCSYPMIMANNYQTTHTTVIFVFPLVIWIEVFTDSIRYFKRAPLSRRNTISGQYRNNNIYSAIFMYIIVTQIILRVIRVLYLYNVLNDLICYITGQEVSSVKCTMPKLYYLAIILVHLTPFICTILFVTKKRNIRNAVCQLCRLSTFNDDTKTRVTRKHSVCRRYPRNLSLNETTEETAKSKISGTQPQTPELPKTKSLKIIEPDFSPAKTRTYSQENVPVVRIWSPEG